MTRLHTLLTRIDTFLASDAEPTETTMTVKLRMPTGISCFACQDIAQQTGAIDLYRNGWTNVTISYVQNDTDKRVDVKQIKFPNDKISLPKRKQSEGTQELWYEEWQQHRKIEIAYYDPKQYCIIPSLQDRTPGYRIDFDLPK